MAIDRQQQHRDQNAVGLALIATISIQVVLSFTLVEWLAFLLPAIGLGVVAAVLALRSESALSSLQHKRPLLAIVSLASVALFALAFLVDDPRSVLMMQLSRMVFIDLACLGLGRLCASLITGNRPALR